MEAAALNRAVLDRAEVANRVHPVRAEALGRAAAANRVRLDNPAHRTSPACLDNLTRQVNLAHLDTNISGAKRTRTAQAIQTQPRVKAALPPSSLLLQLWNTGGPYRLAGFFFTGSPMFRLP